MLSRIFLFVLQGASITWMLSGFLTEKLFIRALTVSLEKLIFSS